MTEIKKILTLLEASVLKENNQNLINSIKTSLNSFKPGGYYEKSEIRVNGNDISIDFRHLGNWVHDEEDHYDDEDDDWREDDDQMIWAPGEYKKYSKRFEDWAKTQPWYKYVTLGVQTSEKNWVEFSITLKK